MNNLYERDEKLSQENIASAIRIWNSASVSLLDIRHNLISSEEALREYRLPTSAFLYTSNGRAEVLLGDKPHQVDRFGLFHAGKGTELSIYPRCDWLEYYMVLYKAEESPFYKREEIKRLEQVNPFRQEYGFTPTNPLFFAEQLRKMYEKWKGPTQLNLFYGKAAFYQLIYEIYEELDKGSVQILEPDMIAIAQQYIDKHYSTAVSIQEMREQLGISNSHFHRLFTARTGQSPQEYLIAKRLSAAKRYLAETNCTLREIAVKSGFSDELSLMRMFKKHVRMSTTEYRDICTYQMGNSSIEKLIPFPYNEEGRVSTDKLKGKGATYMFNQMKNKTVMAAALSVVMLLSACGTVPANTSEASSARASAVSSQMTENEENTSVEESTRTINTIMGEVEVPTNPQRIVASGFWVGDILAFGKEPIGIQDFYVNTSPWSDQAKNITVLEKWEPEHIMALEPDLIITGAFGGKADDYEELSKIAPTVAFDWDDEPETRLPLMAQALGLEAADGEALVNEYNQKIENYRKQLKETGILDKTITVFRNDGLVEDGLELGGEIGWGGEVVYGLFDMKMPESVKRLKESSDSSISNVSYEVVPELCGDYILMNQSDVELIKQLDDNAIWQSIPAVQNGNVIVVEPGKVYFPDIITDTYKLEIISEALLSLANK
ncbi:AraC family transcriptional regulator [Scatolibacter rhodanostii]|uniref:AraC family transcriptional regulator n=1 Tax=Scatolibacter rhodanostii TaxID=2014781 RepID=UPI000C07323E|nr:AraC family transcriptional regulator [Scatolibacter rhodanostii]